MGTTVGKMLRNVAVGLGATVLAVAALGSAAGAMAGSYQPRGEFVSIGERRLRVVCEGPATASPLVVMEAGAFGIAADFAALQASLAERGVRSCAYDRAGLGWSDPAPGPRDAAAVSADLAALLKARGETGPLVLMGHSMAGIHLRALAARLPDQVKGLVLIEAVVPTAEAGPFERRFVPIFQAVANLGAAAGTLGLMNLYPKGDDIGLPPAAAAEKARAYRMGRHMRSAASEGRQWRAGSAAAAALPPYRPEWPVAVILAGAREDRNSARAAPARLSRHGFVEIVPEASHASVLGTHRAAVLRGVEHVLRQIGE